MGQDSWKKTAGFSYDSVPWTDLYSLFQLGFYAFYRNRIAMLKMWRKKKEIKFSLPYNTGCSCSLTECKFHHHIFTTWNCRYSNISPKNIICHFVTLTTHIIGHYRWMRKTRYDCVWKEVNRCWLAERWHRHSRRYKLTCFDFPISLFPRISAKNLNFAAENLKFVKYFIAEMALELFESKNLVTVCAPMVRYSK